MGTTALAYDDDYDEDPMISTEVIEANLAAMKESLIEFKTEIRNGLAEVRTGLADVRTEMRTGLKEVRTELAEVRTEMRDGLAKLSTRIDATNKDVTELTTTTTRDIAEVSKAINKTTHKLNAVLWFCSTVAGPGSLLTILSVLNNHFHWF